MPSRPEKLAQWVEKLRFYRNPPNTERIVNWLSQFDAVDRGLAERILDKIRVVSDEEILIGYRDFLANEGGWHRNQGERQGRWYFLGFGGAGESGPAMVRSFREANRLNAPRFNELFVNITDLPRLQLTAKDTVVFIDDISGSGDQAVGLWPTLAELIASEAKAILVLTAVTETSKDRLSNETELQIRYRDLLGPADDFFDDQFPDFSSEEKNKIEAYCNRADPKNPRGYGNCGLLYILAHKTPNNCLPVIHSHNNGWSGILPRYTPLPE